MATRIANSGNWRGQVRHIGTRAGAMLSSLAVLAFALLIGFALASYSSTDPALNTAAAPVFRNVLGPIGAWGADLLLTFFGLPAILLIPPLVVVALRLWRGVHPGQWKRALPITILAMLFCDLGMGLVHLGLSSSLPAGRIVRPLSTTGEIRIPLTRSPTLEVLVPTVPSWRTDSVVPRGSSLALTADTRMTSKYSSRRELTGIQ